MAESGHPLPDPDALINIELPSRPDSPRDARSAITGLDGLVGHEILARLRLLVTELVANSVKHAHGAPIRLVVAASPEVVRTTVTDDGAAFEPPDRRDPMRTGGWGLVLVRRLADRWGIAPGDGSVWFEIDQVSSQTEVAPPMVPGDDRRSS